MLNQFWKQLLAAVLATMSLWACGPVSDTEFRNAVPDKKAVTINAPATNGSALTLGTQADYYVFTYDMTRMVNGTIGALLDLVAAVMATPSSSHTDNQRIWGPGAGDALDPLVYKLTVTKQVAGKFTWSLDARKKSDPEAETSYLPMLSGVADVSSGINKGSGTMDIPTNNWATLKGDLCGAGDLAATYDTTVEPQSLQVVFAAFHPSCADTNGTTEASMNAKYVYHRLADGSGDFQFSNASSLPNSSVPSQPYAVIFAVRSRWDATGAGRADVSITGQSDLVAALGACCASAPTSGCCGVTSITASECWDSSFNLTFATLSPVLMDQNFGAGSESSCAAAFATAQFATDI